MKNNHNNLPSTSSSVELLASPAVLEMLYQEKKRVTNNRILFLLGAIGILIFAGIQSELNFPVLLQNSGNMVEYTRSYFPPDFSDWRLYLEDTIITISMGIWGTLMAAIAAIPLSLLGSENIFPVWIVQPIRRILDAMRAINEIVFALIFVVAVGLGPFAGVLALFVSTTGTLGKLFSEVVESIDPGPVEGIRATGAEKIQEILFGILPQVMPLWTSYILYRFESNVRAASVLGIVGAGGIGVSLYQSFQAFQYQKVCAILIILIVATSTIDFISSKLRNWLV
ncbi:phosphonate ABC transporter, permease protein PhnE [Limnoraphis robusta Tam1]|uniref:Phosphonate ABC transporter, permease protein PhnE n=1 Tax=Limnoraphis robusta CCNP1315 TaxID=3110306 RepID=A0ABU5TWB9_9CYAN|nr:phosphonate ABC transporter, permease protein PhnE [Limnoraphis robusta]MEA5519015.1 phosphonate ABC transporter, permease protein PhnE [Limnoraphis robusta CCNP1315]MEA5538004.1 phosphonate ABC transporter, permease protein PhnE [Limnoraphis robusta Tam1]MEA5544135.1 phosphonate ABC transporter, permease protein PhnE [Limnoraphis robusta CCNP1324]